MTRARCNGSMKRRPGHGALNLSLAVALLALSLLGPACSGKSGSPASFDCETVGKMERAVKDVMEKDGIPGAIVGAWIQGRGEWVAALGTADRETGREMRMSHLMRIGSVTKSFTATLVLVCADRGMLDLDDPLADYFPWVEGSGGITVRMLLNHTSGIVDDYEKPAFWDIASTDPLYRWQPEELVRASLGIDPDATPGEDFNYSNANYLLLGMIVERVTGRTLAEVMDDHIFDPLGLSETVLPDGPEIAGEHAHSYIAVGESGEMYDMTSGIDPSITWAAGAVVSDLDDMDAWVRALATGELLQDTTHEEQLQWVDVPDVEGAGIGYQYGLGVLKVGDFIGHNGEFSGFQASIFYLPAEEASIVVLLNCNANPTGSQDIFTRLAAILFPDAVPETWFEGI